MSHFFNKCGRFFLIVIITLVVKAQDKVVKLCLTNLASENVVLAGEIRPVTLG